MGCNCKDFRQEIQTGKDTIAELRKLFIKRMTVDSDHSDRRRKDYNQAIFHYEDKESIDEWNKDCEKYGFSPKQYGQTFAVWCDMDMDMVLKCFDDAAKDWRKQWCDTDKCSGR